MFFRIVRWNGYYLIDVLTPSGKWFVSSEQFQVRLNAEIAARDFYGMTPWVNPSSVLAEIPGYIES